MLDTLRRELVPLLLRVAFGGMMLGAHGVPKLLNFRQLMDTFPDPLGIGSSMVSLILTILAEVVAAAGVVLGIYPRICAIPLVFVMAVAIFVIHANDPFAQKELAICYGVGFLCILLVGGGRVTISALRRKV